MMNIMKYTPYIAALACSLSLGLSAYGQDATTVDSTTIDRTVVVERDFQPTVQSAGKIAVKPQVYEPTITKQTPVTSTFSNPLSIDYNMHQVDYAGLNFRHPEPLHGLLKAGFGHVNSLFEFDYRISDAQMQGRKKTRPNDLVMDIYASHLGQWGRKTLSESELGLAFSKQFRDIELYFGASGGNDYFTRYGYYFDPSQKSTLSITKFSDIDPLYRQSLWKANAHLGVQNTANADIKYQVQMAYEAFIAPDFAAEHQIHTQGMFEWNHNFHHVGLELDMQNRIYASDSLQLKNNHRIHLQPYYAWEGKRFRAHAGINLDFSAGRGRKAGISPNVYLEADLTKNWLAFYADVKGDYEAGGARDEYKENRYRGLECLFADSISGTYTPLDAQVGFKIRPHKDLLIDLHAGYDITLDQHVNVFGKEAFGIFEHEVLDIHCWKVGADIHYHFRDIVFLNVGGFYAGHNAWKGSAIGGLDGQVFDMPEWQLHVRIDGKINQKWTVYSDNFLMGKRHACVYEAGAYRTEELRPMFDLNLGLQYNVNKWLSVYAQLNNYLAWTDKLSYMTFYGYEAQRANCMFGLSWSF